MTRTHVSTKQEIDQAELDAIATESELDQEVTMNETTVTRPTYSPTLEDAKPATAKFGTVEFRRYNQTTVSFGDTRARKHYLNSYGKIMGFINGLIAVVDGTHYKYLGRGLHMHIDPDPAKVKELYVGDNVGSVSFSALSPESLQYVEGLENKDDLHYGWWTLNVRHGNLVLGKKVAPVISSELPEDADEYKVRENNAMWTRYFKQEGVELAMSVVGGHLRVINSLKVEAGMEWKLSRVEKKYAQLGMTLEDRTNAYWEAAANGKEWQATKIGAANIAKYPELKDAAMQASKEVALVKANGEEALASEEAPISPESLVGHSVQLMRGEYKLGGSSFVRTTGEALAKLRRAQQRAAHVVIVS